MISQLLRNRFLKFGLVGGLGALVNIATLLAGKEWFFSWLPDSYHGINVRLDVALLVSITASIISNYIWNTLWTWRDRKNDGHSGFFSKFPKYIAASWLGVGIQFALANVLVYVGVYYLLASAFAILAASGVNFVLNDRWTFGTLQKAAASSNSSGQLSE